MVELEADGSGRIISSADCTVGSREELAEIMMRDTVRFSDSPETSEKSCGSGERGCGRAPRLQFLLHHLTSPETL